ncbi:uncharacterized protein LOC110105387 [Dendrobium catenatum]|uniref:uncharacterized protein LOC110105387 n=1 Tax=Dendrobium catenatum TaxID=906689 RepID=UPI0009F2BCDA|nr:uncharacterized protein LOC110105387 [Dendrobium catenatum]
MKCPAVACLWPPSAPSHRITAVTVLLHNPPSLFTGGSDGAIVCWALSDNDVRPLALLCGHAAEISVLVPFRRRRKLPKWAGIPSHLAALPSSPRHVLIACSSGESSKSPVLIVDSSTLLLVQTILHGSLGIGYVKSMAIVGLQHVLIVARRKKRPWGRSGWDKGKKPRTMSEPLLARGGSGAEGDA